MVRSNYVSSVDKEKCVACGECVKHCPVNALQLGQKICSSTPVTEEIIRDETPGNTEWGPEKWNPDYRVNRKNVVDTGTSPCKTACPAHIAVQGYIKLASQGKYTEALELIKLENPFPAVCGRICPKDCESECTRGDVDEPIAIDDIKRFIAERELNAEHRLIPAKKHSYDKKIAVVGGGPSGLSCAYYLAIDGYAVTVFEKQTILGGMLTLGIPSFRLEKNIINAEIDILRTLGVEFKTGVEIGKDVSLADLRAEGYAAFYLAIGAQSGRALGIEGEDADGVFAGVDFLRSVNAGEDLTLTGKTIIIGGGNVAIDVARTAVRVGASAAAMYCLESRETMPALEEEIEEALSEGIAIHGGWGPQRILTENNRVTGVEFKRCLSVFDENGRFSPVYDEADLLTVDADHVLISVGQSIDWGGVLTGGRVQLRPNRTAVADAFTLQTDEPDVFAGGDACTGPKFAIDAIAHGKEAAISIHRYVQEGQSLVIGRDRREYISLDKDNAVIEGFDNTPRQRPLRTKARSEVRQESFRDMRGVLTEEQLRKETERCLGCGAVIRDEYLCVGCGQCTTKCKFEAITLARKYDGEGVAWEAIKPVVIKQLIKRKGRIAAKKVKNAFAGKAEH